MDPSYPFDHSRRQPYQMSPVASTPPLNQHLYQVTQRNTNDPFTSQYQPTPCYPSSRSAVSCVPLHTDTRYSTSSVTTTTHDAYAGDQGRAAHDHSLDHLYMASGQGHRDVSYEGARRSSYSSAVEQSRSVYTTTPLSMSQPPASRYIPTPAQTVQNYQAYGAAAALSSTSSSVHHTSTPSPDSERYACDKCDRTFSRNHDRKRHYETHHLPPVAHVCPHCRKSFSRADSLKRHTDNGCDRMPNGGSST